MGIHLNGESYEQLIEDLDELESLLDTLGVKVQARIVQKRHRLTAKTLLGTGKVDEIKSLADAYDADWVVFERPLSPHRLETWRK